MRLRRLAASCLLASALAFTGAAGARAAGPPPSAQLALMPLPLAAYGRKAAGLRLVADTSGRRDNAQAADDSSDPNDSAASLAAAGRLTGVQLSFADLGALARPGSLVGVASRLALYRTGRAASVGLRGELDDTTRSDPSSDFRVLSSTRFAAPRLEDEAAGMRVAAKVGTVKIWFTGVGFRRGSLIGLVAVVRTDARPEQARVVALAHALAARVEGVLAGRITTPPAKFP